MTDLPADSVVVGFLHHNEISGAFLNGFMGLAGADDRVMVPPIANQCNTDLASGRNQIVAAFLNQTPAEWLLMIDDDMGFGPDLVDRLLRSAHPERRPAVGGLCFAYKRYEFTSEGAEHFYSVPTLYALAETENEIGFSPVADYPKGETVQVDATGCACLLLHRSLLEGMHEALGPNWFTPVTVPKGPSGQTIFSEDLSFCYRLKAAGVPLFVNTAAKTSHRKPIYLDEWYYENQPVRTVEPELAIVGTGRSGSKFIAAALSACGLAVGHEEWWNPHNIKSPGLFADVSWLAANYLDEYPGRVWHQTRHPLLVVRSLLSGPLFDPNADPWVTPYEAERRRWAGYSEDDTPETKALRVVAHWLQVCDKHAERTWRLEDVTPGFIVELADDLGVDVPLKFARAVVDAHGTTTNKHPDGNRTRWADLPDGDDKQLIEHLAAGFGYDDMELGD